MADRDQNKDETIDTNIDLNDTNFGESLETGFDALGKVFGGLVGAIKDAVGPEMMKTLGAANWLGQVAECLETLSKGLSTDGSIPSEAAGQFSFLADQLDANVDGSKLEAQKATIGEHLQNSRQALDSADNDPQAAAKALAHAVGYFKAAATSVVPIQPSSNGDSDDE